MALTKTTTLRLRRVRFKNGKTIEILRKPKKDEWVRNRLLAAAPAAVESHGGNIEGFALVVWTGSGEVWATYENGDKSLINAGGVPQYVKDVLLAEVAVRWSRD